MGFSGQAGGPPNVFRGLFLLLLLAAAAGASVDTGLELKQEEGVGIEEKQNAPEKAGDGDAAQPSPFSRKFRKQLQGLEQKQPGAPQEDKDEKLQTEEKSEPSNDEDFGSLSPSNAANPAGENVNLGERRKQVSFWKVRAKQLKKNVHLAVIIVCALYFVIFVYQHAFDFVTSRAADLYVRLDEDPGMKEQDEKYLEKLGEEREERRTERLNLAQGFTEDMLQNAKKVEKSLSSEG